MARAKGIHSHKIYKLGKAPAKADVRNLKFASILKAAPKVPNEFDFDLTHKGIPLPMFANDNLGCCVISGRAHQTLRFEDIEQGAVITITDQEIRDEYFKETGGADDGLIVLDSLKEWRSDGWTAAGQLLKIKAFAQLNPTNHSQIKQAIFLDVGIGLGIGLPLTAQAQFQAGKPWDFVGGPDSAFNSWGGHYVFVPGYTKVGPVCVTWGQKHQMTWAFVNKYCDEAYAIFDALNTAKLKKALDVKEINSFLAAL
ncbi:MAG: hypothetical protein ACJ74T_12335 [Pyrinomonadaceae bacterium]